MRYKLTACIVGEIYIPGPAEFKRDDFIYKFHCDRSGRMTEVSVSLKIPKAKIQEFKSEIGPGRDKSVATYTFNVDPDIHDLLITELQNFEANLGFRSAGGLRRIEWHRPEQELVPENAAEEKLAGISTFSVDWQYRPVIARLEHLDLIRATSHQYDNLGILKAFWLDGIEEFNRFRFVQAFLTFYLVIEDLYSKSKTGEKEVLKEFARSRELTDIIEGQFKSVLEEARHRENLERLFKQYRSKLTVAGTRRVLFRVRGNLRHYFSKSPKTKATPYNQKEFESIALLTMLISTAAISKRMAAIDQA